MMDAIAWIEQSAISTWVREDFYAYFVLLILHAWGMAFLVGGGFAICLRILGFGKKAELSKFKKLFPFMWLGAFLAIFSGIGLLLGYPAKALTNWVFAFKFACLIIAALLMRSMTRASFGKTMEPVGVIKIQSVLALAFWLGGMASGKMLLYTNDMLLTTDVEW